MNTSSFVEDLGQFKTLEQFILEDQLSFPHAYGSFTRLLYSISLAAKIINHTMRRAGLADIGGATGTINVQGEVQQKMDLAAHREFVRALYRSGECCLIGSEEHDEAIPLRPDTEGDGRYVVLFDPLDGSTNIEVNISVGTIFSIYHLPEGVEPSLEAALRPGCEQVAAGYVVYGSSTILVYTTGNGVNGFTLDPSIGEFLLSHPNIQTPKTARVYSVNEGNYNAFEPGLRQYIKWCQREDDATGRPYTTRYIGSFVADFHRNLLHGGLYIYPNTTKNPNGKLRLMYEANPLAFIAEQAGGLAIDGTGRLLDQMPTSLHQRTPLYIGSPEMVERVQRFLTGDEV
ncbi:MAG: class 1 fructose-bisphosphatase [Bacteroidota bacterium]